MYIIIFVSGFPVVFEDVLEKYDVRLFFIGKIDWKFDIV